MGGLEGNFGGISQLFLETASLTGLELSDKLGVSELQDPFISASSVLGLQAPATVPGSLKRGSPVYKARSLPVEPLSHPSRMASPACSV